jgi:hypothetical protein
MPMLMPIPGLPVEEVASDNVIPFRGAKPPLLEGGFMPRGGSGRSAEVVQFPQSVGRVINDKAKLMEAHPEGPSRSAYDAAVARQKGRPEPSDFDQSIALLKRALNSTNPKTQANIEAAFAKFSPVQRYFVEQKLGMPLGPVAPRPSAEVVRIPGFEGPLPQGRNPGQFIRGGLQGDGKPVYPKLVE